MLQPIHPEKESREMPDTRTFGRYAEIPYEQMTPEQQEGYRFAREIRGAVGGPSKIWVHNPKLAKATALLGTYFHPGHYSLTEASARSPSALSPADGIRPIRRARIRTRSASVQPCSTRR
jgi:hypothetical protein